MTLEQLSAKWQNIITGVIINAYADAFALIEARGKNPDNVKLLDTHRTGEFMVKTIAEARKIIAEMAKDATEIKATAPPTQRK